MKIRFNREAELRERWALESHLKI